LGNRNFRLFLIGMFFSSTGVWTQRIAQDWLVLDLTNSPTQVGITTMLQYLPMLLFGLVGGLAADRYSRRRILVCTQVGMMLLAITLAVLTLTHEVRPWQVFIVAFLVGTVFAFDIPTRQSFVNELVSERHVRNAIGLTATVFQVGALVGPAASGALIGAVGPGYAFATTAVTYLVPMTALLWMDLRGAEAPAVPPGPVRLLHEMREAFRYVAGRPEILWTIVLVGTFGTFISNLPVTNAAFARLVFHNGPGGYGLLGSVGAIGAVLGALFAATRHRRPRLRSNLAVGALLAALYVLASVVPGFVGYAIVLVAIGAVTITFMTSCNSTVQIAADLHVRGRIMGLYNLVFIGSGAAGGPLIGAVDQYAGPRIGMLASGVIPAVISVFVAIQLLRALNLRVRLNLREGLAAALVVTPAKLPPAAAPVVAFNSPSCRVGGCGVAE
jgi:MFS family permease